MPSRGSERSERNFPSPLLLVRGYCVLPINHNLVDLKLSCFFQHVLATAGYRQTTSSQTVVTHSVIPSSYRTLLNSSLLDLELDRFRELSYLESAIEQGQH